MKVVTTSEAVFGMSGTLRVAERTLRATHFLRQSILTQRKLASSINRRWCENQSYTAKQKSWML